MIKLPKIGKTIFVGLKSATEGEIEDIKSYVKSKHRSYEHKTHTTTGKVTPYNGILIIK